MRNNRATPVAISLVALAALCAVALSQETAEPASASGPRLVHNVWVDTPLSQVLRDISMQVGVTIAVDPTVSDHVVSLECDGMPLEECLRLLLAGQGLTARRLDERLYVIGSSRPDSPGFSQVAEAQRLYLRYVTAKHLRDSLPTDLKRYVTSGERMNEALAFAPAEQMQRIMEIVRQVDVPQRQVVLEALVVELSREGGAELGVDWEWSGHDAMLALAESTGPFLGTARYTTISERDYAALLVTLRALIKQGKASIRSRPRVATLDAEKAMIDVSLEEYFTILKDINGSFLRTELQVVKSGVILRMTPQIGDNGDITVDISTEVSDVAKQQNSIRGGSGESVAGTLPVIRRRKAESKVRVKEGDAIVIGGLVESQERDEVKRVPILGAIPLVGTLFRSTRTDTVEREVIIFITPRLMTGPEPTFSGQHKLLDVDEEMTRLVSGKGGEASSR